MDSFRKEKAEPVSQSKKYTVILFQPYLRRFVLNIGQRLKQFEFRNVAPDKKIMGYHTLSSYEKEFSRNKVTWQTRIRRFLGIPNVRIRFDQAGDLYFTYACLLITRKPYCTYIETGVALYNYDIGIAKNPIARWLVILLATRRNCRWLIFLSEAGRKSFFATVTYPAWARRRLEAKSRVIYPIPIEKQSILPRKFKGTLHLLFPGTFYIKGGLQVAQAYERLRQKYTNVTLTIITALHIVKPEDIAYMRSLSGLTLQDAKLSEAEMIKVYRSHDIFLLPTYRDGFGLVLIEALAYGLPVIITDQYATAEMVRDGYNGFIYPNHPFKDYDPKTYKMFGRYYNPRDLYRDIFQFHSEEKLKPVEDFLVAAVEKFLKNPQLLETFSRHSLELYREKFDAEMLSNKFESAFLEAVEGKTPRK